MANFTGTAGADHLVGTNGFDILDGLGGDDLLEGREQGDTLYGRDGNDTLRGESGNDLLYGGAGDDVLEGGADNDFLVGEAGNDQMDGGAGDDGFSSSAGSDTMIGGEGNDGFYVDRGGGLADVINASGGGGADSFNLNMMSGTINADGGDGDDVFRIDGFGATYRLTLGAGRDTVRVGAPFSNSVVAPVVITDFQPGSSGDRLDLSYFLYWRLTNWDFNTNPFSTGHLRLVQSGAHTVLEMDADGGGNAFTAFITFENTAAIDFTWENLDGFPPDGSVAPPQNLTGTEGRDVLVGASGNDQIDGLGEQDDISGGSGDDILRGGAGRDTLNGEGGNDVIEGGDDGDFIDVGWGNDEARGGGAEDTIYSRSGGNDLLYGEGGNDYIMIERRHGPGDIVRAESGEGDDTVFIAAYGANHNYIVDLGIGSDKLHLAWVMGTVDVTLGAGADRILFDDAQNSQALRDYVSIIVRDFETGATGDVLDFDVWLTRALANWDKVTNPFGTGHLRLVQEGADALLQIDWDGSGSLSGFRTIVTFKNTDKANLTQENLDGYPGDGSAPAGRTIIGTTAGETLEGTAGADRIEGRGGLDTLNGGGGNDTIIGGSDRDTINGGAGDDTIEAGGGNDNIDGGPGADIIDAGAGDDFANVSGGDVFHGGDGADFISLYEESAGRPPTTVFGDGGNDTIRIVSYALSTLIADGGEGDDSFSVSDVTGSATLTLGAGTDTVRFDLGLFNGGYPGDIAVTDFVPGAGGDILNLDSLAGLLTGWTAGTNPFTTGYARLVQSGSDTHLQLDRDGGGDGYQTVVRLLGTAAAAFGASNFLYAVPAVYGSSGNDLAGGAEAGTIYRMNQGGNDVVSGAGGDDVVYFGNTFNSADRADGGAGADALLLQGAYNLTIAGTQIAGIETLRLMSGGDSSHGAAPGGALSYTFVLDTVLPGARFTVDGSGLGAGEVLTLTASDPTGGSFAVAGGAAADTIVTGEGHDLLDGGAGNDTLRGGGGSDVYIVDSAGDVVDEQPGGGTDEIRTSLAAYSLAALPDGEKLTGLAPTGQSLTGNDGANGIQGGSGGDSISGGGGDDTLRGGDGSDNISGGEGSDTLDGEGGSDTLAGGLGDDVYYVDSLDFLVEADGDGYDYVYARTSFGLRSGVHVELLATVDYRLTDGFTLIGSELANSIVGNNGHNAIYGGGGDDTLRGLDGQDVLDGQAGTDYLIGGSGDDIYYVDGVDVAEEAAGEGYDIVYARSSYALTTQSHVEMLATEDFRLTVALSLSGNQLNNNIVGNNGHNTLDGRAGDDTLRGLHGDDTLYGGDGNDYLIGGVGNDIYYVDSGDTVDEAAGEGNDAVYASGSFALAAGSEVETLATQDHASTTALDLTGNEFAQSITGNNGANFLRGGGGADTIRGLGGDDAIDGGAGRDYLIGGDGVDTFRFSSVVDSAAGAADTIADFLSGTDRIDLSAIDAKPGTAGDDAFTFIGTAAFTGKAGELRYDVVGSGVHIQADVDGDGVGDLYIVAEGSTLLVSGDFIL